MTGRVLVWYWCTCDVQGRWTGSRRWRRGDTWTTTTRRTGRGTSTVSAETRRCMSKSTTGSTSTGYSEEVTRCVHHTTTSTRTCTSTVQLQCNTTTVNFIAIAMELTGLGVQLSPLQFMSTDAHFWVKIGFECTKFQTFRHLTLPRSFRLIPTLPVRVVVVDCRWVWGKPMVVPHSFCPDGSWMYRLSLQCFWPRLLGVCSSVG